MKNRKALPMKEPPDIDDWRHLSFAAVGADVLDKLRALSDLVRAKERSPDEDRILSEALAQILEPISRFVEMVELAPGYVTLSFKPSSENGKRLARVYRRQITDREKN